MDTIVFQGPSRDTVRLIYDMAMAQAQSDVARKTIGEALRFQEMVWSQQDMAKKKEAQHANHPPEPNGE